MPTSTVEDYLKAILLAQQRADGLVPTGQIATDLSVTPGTATAMIKTLAASGLVEYEPYRAPNSPTRAASWPCTCCGATAWWSCSWSR
jgi:Mn-dependent DtxR family transcriptional regulator